MLYALGLAPYGTRGKTIYPLREAARGMRTGNDKEEVRRARVRQLFETRYPGERTETEVLAFYGWLTEHHPELLLQKRHGSRYQDFKSDLLELYKAT